MPRPKARLKIDTILQREISELEQSPEQRARRDKSAAVAAEMSQRFGKVEIALPPGVDVTSPKWNDRNIAAAPLDDIPAQFPPDDPNLPNSENARAISEMLAPYLRSVYPEGQWDQVIKGPHGNWRVDYMNDAMVINFKHAKGAEGLRSLLRMQIHRYLWGMLALKAHLRDERYYTLIITYPKDADLDIDLSGPTAMSRVFRNDSMLLRLMSEAQQFGMSLFLVRTPAQLISLLKYPELGVTPDWEDETDD